MEPGCARRSPRLAMELPVRVFGFDYQGIDFVEDATTAVVSQHGAKIWLRRNLIVEQEIRILCHLTRRDSVFRVVCRAAGTKKDSIFWGVECLELGNNIWGIDFPDAKPQDQRSVRLVIQCPECRTREIFYSDERLVAVVQEMGGLLRGCRLCGKSGLWKSVPYTEA